LLLDPKTNEHSAIKKSVYIKDAKVAAAAESQLLPKRTAKASNTLMMKAKGTELALNHPSKRVEKVSNFVSTIPEKKRSPEPKLPLSDEEAEIIDDYYTQNNPDEEVDMENRNALPDPKFHEDAENENLDVSNFLVPCQICNRKFMEYRLV
jgi:hypothetical protein